VPMKVRPLSEAHPHPLGYVWASEPRRSMGAIRAWNVPLRGDLGTRPLGAARCQRWHEIAAMVNVRRRP